MTFRWNEKGVAVIAYGVLLVGLLALVAVLTVMGALAMIVVGALSRRVRPEGKGRNIAAVVVALAIVVGFGLFFPLVVVFFSKMAVVAARAVASGAHGVRDLTVSTSWGYELLPLSFAPAGPDRGFLIALLIGFLILVWLLANRRTRSVATAILGACAATLLIGGVALLGYRAQIGPLVTHVRPVPTEWAPLTIPLPTARPPVTIPLPAAGIHHGPRAPMDDMRHAIDRARADVERTRAEMTQYRRAAIAEVAPATPRQDNAPADPIAPGDERPPLAAETADSQPGDETKEKEQPADKPAEIPAEQPAEHPAEKPAEQSPEQPTAQPVEQPRDEPAEKPVDRPAEQPAEAADHGAVDAGKAVAQEVPDWVKTPPKRVGNSYLRTAVSEPFSSDAECYEWLDDGLMMVTFEYLADLLGRHFPHRPESVFVMWQLRRMGITPAYIRKNICKDEFVEYIDSSVDKIVEADFGQMRRIHVLMAFDSDIQRDLKRRWKDTQLVERLAVVGGGTAIVLLLIGLVFAYLKIDTATRGFYSRRLQLAAGLVTILIAAAIVVLSS